MIASITNILRNMSSVTHLLFNSIINGKDSNNICCLCLEKIGEDGFILSDEVTIDTEHGEVMEGISTILETLLITEMVQFFNAVCKQCMDSAISSYKFIKRSKEKSEILTKAVDSLVNCFNVDTGNHKELYGSLYVLVNEDFEVQQIYDEVKQEHPKQTGSKRLQYILKKITEKPNPGQCVEKTNNRREKDVSTIFIKTHELIHDPSKPKEYKCKMCLRLYPNSGNLRQHFFASHFKKDYQCPNCAKGFGTERLLRKHVAQSHFLVECEDCGKTLRNRSSTLKRHAHIHTKEPKACDRCGRTYKKRADFERHVAQEKCIHPSRMPGDFQCEQCMYHCRFKHQMAQHIKYEHTDAQAHICKWCNKRCYSQSALKTHILKHTKEKNFVCSECGGRFVTRQSLINHLRLHTGERPYKCLFCEQSFLSASRRKEHIERKHVDVVYECDLCDARYNARRSLTKHRKKHFEGEFQHESEVII